MKPEPEFANYAATIILVGAALTVAAVCAWHWSNPEAPPAAVTRTPTAAPVATPAARIPRADYTEIAGWRLFGEPAKVSTEPEAPGAGAASIESLDDLPASAVALTVTGTVTASSADGARAVIMDSAGRQSEVAIGDLLPGNIELRAIERTRIVIRRDGVLEAVALPQPKNLLPNRNRAPVADTARVSPQHESNLTFLRR